MEVDFIHRTDDNYWGFWNDYTIEGILDIYPPPDIIDTTLLTATSVTTASKSHTSRQEVPHTNFEDMHIGQPNVHLREQRTTANTLDNVTDEKAVMEFSDSDTSDQKLGRKPRLPRQIETNILNSDSDSVTSMEAEDTKRPVTRTADTQHPYSAPDTPSRVTHINLLSPPTSDIDDDEGFLPVPTRKRNKDKRSDKSQMDKLSHMLSRCSLKLRLTRQLSICSLHTVSSIHHARQLPSCQRQPSDVDRTSWKHFRSSSTPKCKVLCWKWIAGRITWKSG